MGKVQTTEQQSIQTLRQKAVDEAWEKEVELVRTGKGTRQWTAAEQKELSSTGKVEGYQGHHMVSVRISPENAGNKDNIQFLNHDEHFSGAHEGNYKNFTKGYYNPQTGKMEKFEDENVKPITPVNLKEKAFSNDREREDAYKQGLIDRHNQKLDASLANREKNLEQRNDLTLEQKQARMDKAREKNAYQKAEFQKAVQENSAEKIVMNNNNTKNDFTKSNYEEKTETITSTSVPETTQTVTTGSAVETSETTTPGSTMDTTENTTVGSTADQNDASVDTGNTGGSGSGGNDNTGSDDGNGNGGGNSGNGSSGSGNDNGGGGNGGSGNDMEM